MNDETKLIRVPIGTWEKIQRIQGWRQIQGEFPTIGEIVVIAVDQMEKTDQVPNGDGEPIAN